MVEATTPATEQEALDAYSTIVTSVAELVVAGANRMGFPGSVTAGVVRGLARSRAAGEASGPGRLTEDVTQRDAAWTPGNRGGALAAWPARLIGVNTAVAGMGLGLA